MHFEVGEKTGYGGKAAVGLVAAAAARLSNSFARRLK